MAGSEGILEKARVGSSEETIFVIRTPEQQQTAAPIELTASQLETLLVQISDGSIPQAKIAGLVAQLATIESDISTLQSTPPGDPSLATITGLLEGASGDDRLDYNALKDARLLFTASSDDLDNPPTVDSPWVVVTNTEMYVLHYENSTYRYTLYQVAIDESQELTEITGAHTQQGSEGVEVSWFPTVENQVFTLASSAELMKPITITNMTDPTTGFTGVVQPIGVVLAPGMGVSARVKFDGTWGFRYD